MATTGRLPGCICVRKPATRVEQILCFVFAFGFNCPTNISPSVFVCIRCCHATNGAQLNVHIYLFSCLLAPALALACIWNANFGWREIAFAWLFLSLFSLPVPTLQIHCPREPDCTLSVPRFFSFRRPHTWSIIMHSLASPRKTSWSGNYWKSQLGLACARFGIGPLTYTYARRRLYLESRKILVHFWYILQKIWLRSTHCNVKGNGIFQLYSRAEVKRSVQVSKKPARWISVSKLFDKLLRAIITINNKQKAIRQGPTSAVSAIIAFLCNSAAYLEFLCQARHPES